MGCDPNPCPQWGACCDDATATCTQALETNCPGRFIVGAACDPDPFTPPCGEYTCDHSVVLWDCWGDGWNGNTLDVFVDGVLMLDEITLDSGADQLTIYFPAGTGRTIQTVYNAIGDYIDEPLYFLYDGQSILLGQDGIVGTDCYQTPTGITVHRQLRATARCLLPPGWLMCDVDRDRSGRLRGWRHIPGRQYDLHAELVPAARCLLLPGPLVPDVHRDCPLATAPDSGRRVPGR